MRIRIFAAALAVVALVGLVWWSWWSSREPPPATAATLEAPLTEAPAPGAPAASALPLVARASSSPANVAAPSSAGVEHEHERGGPALDKGARRRPRGSVLVDDGVAHSPDARSPEPRSPNDGAMLDKAAVRAGIEAVKANVRDCYEEGRVVEPDLAGALTVSFTLVAGDDGNGVVSDGEIAASDMHSPFFEACVLHEVVGASFPAPGGGGTTTVRYPFHFANDDDADAP